jgi:hypothetical protein
MSQDTRADTANVNEIQRVREIAGSEQLSASEAALECFKEYAKQRPEVVSLWIFGIGFVLGWKLKPW